MEKFFRPFVRFLVRYYLVILVAFLAVGGWSILPTIHLFKHISTDPVDLLPKDYTSVSKLLEIRDKVLPKKKFGVVFESEHPEKTIQLLKDLKPTLEKNPQVGKVYLTKIGYDFFDKHKLLYLDLADLKKIRDRIDRKIQREKLGGLYISFEDEDEKEELDFNDLEEKYEGKYGEGTTSEYYESPNGLVFALYVESKKPNLSIAEEARFQDSIKDQVSQWDIKSYDPSMKSYFAGSTRVFEYRALLRDLKVAGTISGILIFLPLFLRFRKIRFVLLIFFPLVLGIPMGLAFSSLFISKLNVTTSFLFAILGGLGVETGIHLFSRYYEKRGGGASTEDSLVELFVSLGPAILTAVASLAVTFLLMIFSDFKGFSEFGLIAGIGLGTIFIIYFSFFPALLVFAEKVGLLKIAGSLPEEKSRSLPVSRDFVRNILILFGVFTLFSLWATPHLKFEYDSKKIRADDPSIQLAKLKQRLTAGERVNNPAVVLVQNEKEAQAIKLAIEQKKKNNPKTVLDGTSSIYDLVPAEQPAKMEVVNEIQGLLEDETIKLVPEDKKKDLDRFKEALDETKIVNKEDVPPELTELFLGDTSIPGSVFLILAKPKLELDDGRNAIAFASEVEEIKTPTKTYHASSDAVVYADLLRTMFRDSKKILLISLLSVSLFVFLEFRSFKQTGLVLFGILTGVFWALGVFYLLNMKINLYNMVMIPAVMGMSIDNSIHIYHRYVELGKGSLGKVLGTTGISALLASSTNAAGFIGLIFCQHGGLRSMGILATIGLVTCLLSTLVFLPMVLQWLEWRRGEERLNAESSGIFST